MLTHSLCFSAELLIRKLQFLICQVFDSNFEVAERLLFKLNKSSEPYTFSVIYVDTFTCSL